jgi:hypothetical protein
MDVVPVPGLDPEAGIVHVALGIEGALLELVVGNPRWVEFVGLVGVRLLRLRAKRQDTERQRDQDE